MNKRSNYITEGIILAAIPAAGYWAAYLFELGYCHYFQIPPWLIEIPVNAVLLNSLSVLCGIILIIFFVDFVRRIIVSFASAIKYTIFKLIIACFIWFGFYVLVNIPLWVFIAIVVGPVILKDLVWPLWSQRHIKGYLNKVTAAQEDSEFDSTLDHLVNIVGVGALFGLSMVYIMSFIAYFGGVYSANLQTDFLVMEREPDRILVKLYGESWITMRYDESIKQTFPEFKILKTDEIEGIHLQRIGRLTPKHLGQPASASQPVD